MAEEFAQEHTELVNALNWDDETLGAYLLMLFVRAQAVEMGIDVNEITPDFMEWVVANLPAAEAQRAKNSAVEKALHKAALGDFMTAGRLLREHLESEAVDIRRISIGINKSLQASQFGSAGAEKNKAVGNKNYQAVSEEARKILAEWKGHQEPTLRNLAKWISKRLGLGESTVRNYLSRLKREGKLA